jgi:hypothetical protein
VPFEEPSVGHRAAQLVGRKAAQLVEHIGQGVVEQAEVDSFEGLRLEVGFGLPPELDSEAAFGFHLELDFEAQH